MPTRPLVVLEAPGDDADMLAEWLLAAGFDAAMAGRLHSPLSSPHALILVSSVARPSGRYIRRSPSEPTLIVTPGASVIHASNRADLDARIRDQASGVDCIVSRTRAPPGEKSDRVKGMHHLREINAPSVHPDDASGWTDYGWNEV